MIDPILPIWQLGPIGYSWENRPIPTYISGSPQPGPIDTLIFAAIHGDEPESEVLASYFLREVAPLSFAYKRVVIIPLLNPDGFQRKQRTNAYGVDLNRNFPTQDWAELGQNTIYYSGPSPASEPETQFLMTLLKNYPPLKILSIHTPYRVINYDGPAQTLANLMATQNGYPVVEDIGYATPGSFGTHIGKERHIPVITLELPEDNFTQSDLEANASALIQAILWHPDFPNG